MGNPQGKRQAIAPPPGESPTKKPHTKERHKKSPKQSPSKEQITRTPSTAVEFPKTPEPMTPKAPGPTTPKTPASAKLLGTKKATATAVRKHATASNTSLHRMLEKLMDMVMEKQPRSVEERKSLLDVLAEQLVNTGLFSLLPSGSNITRKKIIFNAYQVRVGQCLRGNSIELQRRNPLLKDKETFGWNSGASTILFRAARIGKIRQCLRCMYFFFHSANV